MLKHCDLATRTENIQQLIRLGLRFPTEHMEILNPADRGSKPIHIIEASKLVPENLQVRFWHYGPIWPQIESTIPGNHLYYFESKRPYSPTVNDQGLRHTAADDPRFQRRVPHGRLRATGAGLAGRAADLDQQPGGKLVGKIWKR